MIPKQIYSPNARRLYTQISEFRKLQYSSPMISRTDVAGGLSLLQKNWQNIRNQRGNRSITRVGDSNSKNKTGDISKKKVEPLKAKSKSETKKSKTVEDIMYNAYFGKDFKKLFSDYIGSKHEQPKFTEEKHQEREAKLYTKEVNQQKQSEKELIEREKHREMETKLWEEITDNNKQPSKSLETGGRRCKKSSNQSRTSLLTEKVANQNNQKPGTTVFHEEKHKETELKLYGKKVPVEDDSQQLKTKLMIEREAINQTATPQISSIKYKLYSNMFQRDNDSFLDSSGRSNLSATNSESNKKVIETELPVEKTLTISKVKDSSSIQKQQDFSKVEDLAPNLRRDFQTWLPHGLYTPKMTKSKLIAVKKEETKKVKTQKVIMDKSSSSDSKFKEQVKKFYSIFKKRSSSKNVKT